MTISRCFLSCTRSKWERPGRGFPSSVCSRNGFNSTGFLRWKRTSYDFRKEDWSPTDKGSRVSFRKMPDTPNGIVRAPEQLTVGEKTHLPQRTVHAAVEFDEALLQAPQIGRGGQGKFIRAEASANQSFREPARFLHICTAGAVSYGTQHE